MERVWSILCLITFLWKWKWKRTNISHWNVLERQMSWKKSTITVAVVTGNEAAMKNYCYTVNNTWRRQRDGVPLETSQKGTSPMQLLLVWRTEELNILAATVGPELILAGDTDSLYVDGYNFLYYILPMGTRWDTEEKRIKVLSRASE